MVIEFTGCSSAGKSQLVLDTFRRLKDRNIPVIMGYDYILSQFGISIKNTKIKSIIIDIVLIPTLLWKLSEYIHYSITACKLILKRKDSVFKIFNIMRNCFKQVAVFKFITKRNHDNLYILLDEGTVHLINNIFVHYNTSPNLDVLSKFLPQVPKPDKIIVIDSPIKMIVDRALKRKDPPRKHFIHYNHHPDKPKRFTPDFIKENT